MIYTEQTSRIIGDFLEINADIVLYEQSSPNKFVKIIRHFIAKRNRNKLLNSLKKLRDSNHILDTDNLLELFIYIYNNFPPKGSYNSIKTVKILDEDGNKVEALVSFDNYSSLISIDKRESGFDIVIHELKEGNSNSCSIHCDKMYSDNPRTEDWLFIINGQLLNDMCDYIDSIITQYK